MSKLIRRITPLMACGLNLMAVGIASAAVDKVICVPWQGDVNKQHTIISNQAAQLKCVVKTTDTSAVYGKWVFGDGAESAVINLSGKTKYNLSTTHTYNAATDTPFTAYLKVSNDSNFAAVMQDTYLMKVEANDINPRINIAIDTGLWWLYNNAYSNNANYGTVDSYVKTYDGSTAMGWWQSSHVDTMASPTASAVHAFGINSHKVTGDPDQDPYVEAVRYGMNMLVRGYGHNNSACPYLQALGINPSGQALAPEVGQVSPNGYGVQVYDCRDRQPYQSGQIMDAIVSAGVLPGDLTGRDFTRIDNSIVVDNWTYGELLQDMADMHAWGQWDGGGCNGGVCGSWWYNWNYSSPGDNSASQWGAIGLIPAQDPPWNVVVPQLEKDYNANWLAYSMGCSGPSSAVTSCTYNYFSYNGVSGCAGDSCQQTTTSGLVQMVMDNQTTADLKWTKGQRKIADEWKSFTHDVSTWSGSRTYGWYSFAKAMRLAKPSAVTQLVKTSGASFDWYYGDPSNTTCTTEANCEQGLAPRILEIQTTSGANTGAWQSGNLTDTPLTTAWMIITLRPTLFAASPIACFTAVPNPSYPDQPITFDPSCSGHSDSSKNISNLTKFEWDWNNDGIYDQSTTSPTPVAHSFPCASLPCAYPVTLLVTDDNSPPATATTMEDINITNPPHPPVANAGGPYLASMCPNDSLKLDGSKSFDQDQGQHEAGCTTCQDDTITAYDWDLVPPLTFDAINKTGVKPTVTAANIASFFTVGNNSIGLRVTDNTALAYPGSGQPNLTNAAFNTVDVKSACACNLAARPKTGKIGLTWGAVAGASSYDIYRSSDGPNSGFVVIASQITNAAFVDKTVVSGITYYYRVLASTGCGSNATSAKAP